MLERVQPRRPRSRLLELGAQRVVRPFQHRHAINQRAYDDILIITTTIARVFSHTERPKPIAVLVAHRRTFIMNGINGIVDDAARRTHPRHDAPIHLTHR